MRNIRSVFWVPVLLALAAFPIIYLVRDAGAAPDETKPLSAAACQTMDGIFRPRGIKGKEQLLEHLIDSSDRLATQTTEDLRQAAEIHASYVRLLYAETAGEKPTISEQTHREGLKAYDTIRADAWKRCSLHYLKPAAMS